MDLIIGTHWLSELNSNNNEENKENIPPKEQGGGEAAKQQQQEVEMLDVEGHEDDVNWLAIVDDEVKRLEEEEEKKAATKQKEEEEAAAKEQKVQCACKRTPGGQVIVPLIDHLCRKFKCTVPELIVMFQNLESRRAIIAHLRTGVQLRTNHLRPFSRNMVVRCNYLSTQSAHDAHAYRGYLGISVRVHYYIKHGIRLRHPHLPCVVEYGGSDHRSFYPLEVLSVTKQFDQAL